MSGKNIIVAAALVAAAGTASVANADAILSFTYNNLSGAFTGSAGVGQFTASAVNVSPLRSSASFSRNLAPADSAFFRAGFVSQPGVASFSISISVFNRVGNLASGGGTFIATDYDGDTIRGSVNGNWQFSASGTFFNGENAVYNFVRGQGNGQFDGDFGSSFLTSDLEPLGGLPGFLNQLFIAPSSSGFFETAFANIATTVTGQVLVPGPAALSMLGLAGIVAGRRRR